MLHYWKPHDGEPVSLIFFLDDVGSPEKQCWKYAVTATKHNTEIKLWECKTWDLIQTLSIANGGSLKAAIDTSGSYIVVSDQMNRVTISFNGLFHW